MRPRSLSEWKKSCDLSQKNLKRLVDRLKAADRAWAQFQELEAKVKERPSDHLQHQLVIARRKVTRILARRIT